MTVVDPLRDSRVAGLKNAAAPDIRPPLVVLAGLILLAVGAFWPSIAGLAELWSHPDRRTYQHGYAIAAIALWLLYRERHRIVAAAGLPAPAWIATAAAGGLAWAVAWQAGLQVVHFLLWPAVLWTAAAGILGWSAGRVLLMPVAILYFGLPIWDALTPLLQAATVLANGALASITGLPTLIEDNTIHIPEGSFEIAGGCSGLNYFVVGLAIATLYGQLQGDSLRRRLLLVALGGGLALFSNWLRVFIVIVAGHLSDMQHYLVRVDHYNFGWILYAFVLAAFFLIARRLPHEAPKAPLATRDGRGAAGFAVVAAGAFAILVGPLLTVTSAMVAARLSDRESVGIMDLDLDSSDEWRATAASGAWVPVFAGADAESLVEYTHGDDVVTAYAGTYLHQSQGRELIGHQSRIQGDAEGRFQRQRKLVAVELPRISVIEGEWRDARGGRVLFWWTYQIGERRFTNPLAAQLWYGAASLAGAPVSSVVALRAACHRDCERARLALGRFASDSLSKLLAASVRAGEERDGHD